MSLDEPTMLGPTPEERLRAEKRKKRLRQLAAVVVVVIAVAIGISLLPTPTSTTVYVDPYHSHCSGAGTTFSCTVVLDAKQGYTITASNVKSVEINGTNTTNSVKQSGDSVTIVASVPLVPMENCRPDIGCGTNRPPTAGVVAVYLSDGTEVSAVIGAGGIIKA